MRVAVVVVNYRTPELAVGCLRAVGDDVEAVVVDNASGDGSPARIAAACPRARVVERSSNDGFAAGVNAGFAVTDAPVVVLLNPDTEPRPGAIAALAAHLESSPRAGVAVPRLVHADGRPQPNAYRRDPTLLTLFTDFCAPVGYALERVPALHPHALPPSRYRHGERVAHAMGAALAIRRAAYDDAGPFDERFFLYLEETEWQRRVRAAGWTVELVPGAEVVHLVRGGGEAELVPSDHFLPSAHRYFALRGGPRWAVDVALGAGALGSWIGLNAIAMASPRSREVSRRKAAGYRRIAGRVLRGSAR